MRGIKEKKDVLLWKTNQRWCGNSSCVSSFNPQSVLLYSMNNQLSAKLEANIL